MSAFLYLCTNTYAQAFVRGEGETGDEGESDGENENSVLGLVV